MRESASRLLKKFLSYRNMTWLIVLGLFAFWAWAFSPWTTRGHPDRLDSDEYSVSAAAICENVFPDGEWERGRNEIPSVATPEERSVLVRTSNVELRRLFGGLQDLIVNQDLTFEDSRLISRWLGDWDSYIQDRAAWADLLSTGADEPLAITAVDGARSTDRINTFASINRMRACGIPDFI